MSDRVRPAVVMLAVAALTGACATTVTGSAEPVPGQGPVRPPGDPCTLLTEAQAASLGFASPGKFTKMLPQQLAPDNCTWKPSDLDADFAPIMVAWALDMSVERYVNGAQAGETYDMGGLTWTRYANPFGDSFCGLTTKLSEKSFVEVSSSNVSEDEKACDLAKKVAPLVAENIPQ